jgi:hypothetical protein
VVVVVVKEERVWWKNHKEESPGLNGDKMQMHIKELGDCVYK